MKSESFISIIMLSRHINIKRDSKLLHKIYKMLDEKYSDSEILIINDSSSKNDSLYWSVLLKNTPSVRIINLSSQVSNDVAITAGLENAIGDYIIIFNPAQDPSNIIIESIDLCTDNQVIVGVEKKPKTSLVYRIIRPLLNWLLSEIGYYLPRDATSFRCVSRSIVNSVTQTNNYYHQIYVKISQTGSTQVKLYYNRKNNIKKTTLKSIKELILLLIFNSAKPLRWMSFISIFGSVSSVVIVLYGILSKLLNDQVADGWSSIIILISLFFMMHFIILAFIGEYLSRLLSEKNINKPYWVINELHSSVMIQEERINTTENSIPDQ